MFENALTIEEIFSVRNIIIYLVVVNIIGFLIMFVDKRKAEKNRWRISEKTLFMFSMIGGSIGTLAGMYVFRHKTKKLRFAIGFPAILILQIIIVITLVTQFI